jgi:hypothetical protein
MEAVVLEDAATQEGPGSQQYLQCFLGLHASDDARGGADDAGLLT